MKQYVIRYAPGLSILLVLLGHAVKAYEIPFIHSLDNLIYDTKIKLTMPQTIDERVAILDIDEKSLSEIGRWPWGRDRMATLVDKLFERYRIGILGFDILMPEPDASSGLAVLEGLGRTRLKNNRQYLATLKQIKPQLDYDRLFADSLRGRPVILGYYLANEWLTTAGSAIRIPVDGGLAALVPYRGSRKSYRYYSISDVLADRVKPEQLQGKIVLIGSTAPGLRTRERHQSGRFIQEWKSMPT